jgi:hypothetical protein
MNKQQSADLHRARAEAELILSRNAASMEAAFSHSALAELHRNRAALLSAEADRITSVAA